MVTDGDMKKPILETDKDSTNNIPMPGPITPPEDEPEPECEPTRQLGMWQVIAENIRLAGPVEMVNMFRTVYRSFLATVLVIGGGIFLWTAAFMDKEKVHEQTAFIVGFITASVIGVAIGFYFGGQDRQKKVEPEQQPALLPPPD